MVYWDWWGNYEENLEVVSHIVNKLWTKTLTLWCFYFVFQSMIKMSDTRKQIYAFPHLSLLCSLLLFFFISVNELVWSGPSDLFWECQINFFTRNFKPCFSVCIYRCNNVLYLRGVPEDEEIEDAAED